VKGPEQFGADLGSILGDWEGLTLRDRGCRVGLSFQCLGVSVNLSQTGRSTLSKIAQGDQAVTKPATYHTPR
jgi:hypothetical protein